MKFRLKPQSMTLLQPPKHYQQHHIGNCLPACAQMALSQFGLDLPQDELARRLGTIPGLGTPFPNIERVKEWNVGVEITQWSGFERLRMALSQGQAVITAIFTSSDLPGWDAIRTQHAVLVIDIQDEQIFYHDPMLPTGPVETSLNGFLLAWSDMEELTAFLSYAH